MAQEISRQVEVILTALSGEQLLAFHLQPQIDLLSEIKRIVKRRLGLPPAAQRILQQGVLVEDVGGLEPRSRRLDLTLVVLPFHKEVALRHAASRGHKEAVTALLFQVASGSQECNDMLTRSKALQRAARWGHEAVSRVLLAAAAPHMQVRSMMLEAADHNGKTALHSAAQLGAKALCCVLLDSAPSAAGRSVMLEAPDTVHQIALHYAACMGHEIVSRALLDAAPDMEVRSTMLEAVDCDGRTALHYAACMDHEMVSRALLDDAPDPQKRGLMLETVDCEGKTALHYAACNGHQMVSRALLDAAPSKEVRSMLLKAVDRDGSAALHVAAQSGNWMLCCALLESAPSPEGRGLMLEALDRSGRTALNCAAGMGHDMVSRALLEAARSAEVLGATLEATDRRAGGIAQRRAAAALGPLDGDTDVRLQALDRDGDRGVASQDEAEPARGPAPRVPLGGSAAGPER